MIRLDQRNADVQGTERVFKKVVHGGHNALRFVDKNGLPMRPPNTATLSRLHSTYVLSPRGVPTRKSNHSYSGQLTQDKMQNMVNSLETSSQEMASYASMHSYGNGLSSAGSSRHYLSTANSQKPRTFGPARSAKTMNKSASSQRTHRMLVSAPELEVTNNDPNQEATNDSPQGKRLGKEWSALSQCRALKRSSEIVSHRVDRMYFMSGNKLKLQAKYHVEEDDLQQLRELQAARASSRSSRSGRSKGDVYRPHSLKTDMSNGDLEVGLVVSDEARRANRLRVENGHKENRDPKVIVSQKTLTPRPYSSNKSPIQGWDDNASEKDTTIANGIPTETLHDNDGEEGQKEQNEEGEATEVIKTDAIDNPDNDQGKEMGDKDIKAENNDNEKEVHETNDINGNDNNTKKDVVENKVTVDIDDLVVVTGKKMKGKGNIVEETMGNTNDEKRVQNTEGTSEETDDKDQTDVKSEDYLGK